MDYNTCHKAIVNITWHGHDGTWNKVCCYFHTSFLHEKLIDCWLFQSSGCWWQQPIPCYWTIKAPLVSCFMVQKVSEEEIKRYNGLKWNVAAVHEQQPEQTGTLFIKVVNYLQVSEGSVRETGSCEFNILLQEVNIWGHTWGRASVH